MDLIFDTMKNKIGFNVIFALMSFPIGMALFREFDTQTYGFKNPALGIIYLITFIGTVFLTFNKKYEE